ncbi:MAG: uridine phosphorylase [Ruminiclostridium sp.]|nr:uridine phosphorylase [Ruminiclostridium sp.]
MSILGKFPILEFDPDRQAFIEPGRVIEPIDIAARCVICFFKEVVDRLANNGELKIITELRCEYGIIPIYEMDFQGEKIAVFNPLIGAPSATALLEEVIALGCSKFIACGGAGVLKKDIAVGHLIIPVSAIRDEGTSYHYLPPTREIEANIHAVNTIENVLNRHDIKYLTAKTWTTDAFYRETREKVELRKSEGCVTVEMECSTFFAVSQFRGVTFGQILYGGDDLSGNEWDGRKWVDRKDIRESIFKLAAECCLEL